MNAATTKKHLERRVIDITFSRDFESLLLQTTTKHLSLTHDLEYAAQRGLDRLQELEDVRDIEHIDYISQLISRTNQLSVMDSIYFTHWKVAISEDLLDEIDLLLLSHGYDLQELGLQNVTPATILVLLATAGYHEQLQSPTGDASPSQPQA